MGALAEARERMAETIARLDRLDAITATLAARWVELEQQQAAILAECHDAYAEGYPERDTSRVLWEFPGHLARAVEAERQKRREEGRCTRPKVCASPSGPGATP